MIIATQVAVHAPLQQLSSAAHTQEATAAELHEGLVLGAQQSGAAVDGRCGIGARRAVVREPEIDGSLVLGVEAHSGHRNGPVEAFSGDPFDRIGESECLAFCGAPFPGSVALE